MAEKSAKKAPAPVLANMSREGFSRVLGELKDEHTAADEAAMSVASAYKKFKKQGINLEALRLVRKLASMGNATKVQSFLCDFDKMRELSGFDDQQQLFEEDRTKPQKDAAAASGDNVVSLKGGAGAKPAKPVKAKKGQKLIPAPAEVAPASVESAPLPSKIPEAQGASRAALFDEGDDAEIEEITAVEKARQDGLAKGAAGEHYENPHDQQGEVRDAWHAGWVEGSEKYEEEQKGSKKTA